LETHIDHQWGNYRLIRLLGKGGFAEVYLGEHIHLHRYAAVKVLNATLNAKDAQMFLQEARIVGEIDHPHIVRLLDFNLRGSQPFLVLEYAPHGTLRAKHPTGQLVPFLLIQSYIEQIARALAYVHERKFVHRDVKPANMLIGQEGQILLGDFGIATVWHNTASMQTELLAGTLAYMAPEQIQGQPRAASDQYALAIVAYQWLTGRTPFSGSAQEVMAQHLMTPPPVASSLNPDIPPELDQVLSRALAKDPHARFASIQAFATAFQQALLSPQQGADLALDTVAEQAAIRVTTFEDAATADPEDVAAKAMTPLPPVVAPLPVPTALAASPSQVLRPTPPELAAASPLSPQSLPKSRRSLRQKIALSLTAVLILLGSSGAWLVYAYQSRVNTNPPRRVIATSTVIVSETATLTTQPSPRPTTTSQPTPTPTPPVYVQPTDTPTAAPTPTPTPPPQSCLDATTDEIATTALYGGSPTSTNNPVTVQDCGPTTVNWTSTLSYSSGSGWVTYSPASGTLQANGATIMNILIDWTSLAIGNYSAVIKFYLDGVQYWHINLVLDVVKQ
jgi:cytoskeletal protein RodZ